MKRGIVFNLRSSTASRRWKTSFSFIRSVRCITVFFRSKPDDTTAMSGPLVRAHRGLIIITRVGKRCYSTCWVYTRDGCRWRAAVTKLAAVKRITDFGGNVRLASWMVRVSSPDYFQIDKSAGGPHCCVVELIFQPVMTFHSNKFFLFLFLIFFSSFKFFFLVNFSLGSVFSHIFGGNYSVYYKYNGKCRNLLIFWKKEESHQDRPLSTFTPIYTADLLYIIRRDRVKWYTTVIV